MTLIKGIEKLYIAPVIQDDKDSLVFGTPVYYKGIKELNIRVNQIQENIYGEDQIMDMDTYIESIDIEVLLASLTNTETATLLGQTTPATGGVWARANDKPPYVAVLYKAPLSKGSGYRYGVFYKGLFKMPDEDYKGREDRASYAYPKLIAKFIPTVNGKHCTYKVDTTDPNCPVDIDETWFNAVHLPEADLEAPKVTTDPTHNATSVSGDKVITFTFDKPILATDVNEGNFFLNKEGVAVDYTLSLDATHKIVTMQPVANMTAGKYYAHCTRNVRSTYGVPLEANSLTKFTVLS